MPAGRWPAAPLRLAVVQADAAPGDVGANVRAAVGAVEAAAAAGARLVAFPELFLCRYDLAGLAARPASWLHPEDARLAPLRAASAATGAAVAVGAALRAGDGARWLATLWVEPGGGLGVYAKAHLHPTEQGLFVPGPGPAVFAVGDWRVAPAICLDAAHPAHAMAAAARGAHLYLGASLYWRGEERRMGLQYGARAMDHRMYSAVANHLGVAGGGPSCGRSAVWGPDGVAVAALGHARPAVLHATLEPSALAAYAAGAANPGPPAPRV
jgi:predicted amidohydrolase